MSELPDNCATLLECRTCKAKIFWVSWNWKPVAEGWPGEPAWMLHCVNCGARWLLAQDGLPNPGEIYGASVDLPVKDG